MAIRPALHLDRVTKFYGSVCALDAVSIAVQEGEHCCLLGPNGAGKTTIIRLLEGALQPTQGEIRILGAPAHGAALLDAKRHVGVVPQNPGLYPDLTVREYLEFVRALYGCGDVESAIHDFDLVELTHRALATLSGGFQRRLLVAAAVLSRPSLLLLDEPTVGLDPLAARDTRRLLTSAMAGRTVLMSTHNLAEAEELCSTVIILHQGRVLIHERIEDLRRQATPRVHLVARQSADDLGRALSRLGVTWSLNESGVWISMSEPERTMPDLLRHLLAQGLDVYECRLVSPTLQDLFVDVVTRT